MFFVPRHNPIGTPLLLCCVVQKQYRYKLLQYILQSTIPVPRYFLKKVPSTGTEVLFSVSTE